jgi:hypothetical protein
MDAEEWNARNVRLLTVIRERGPWRLLKSALKA